MDQFNNLIRIHGRPGDCMINNFLFDDNNLGKLYIDVTIGNNMARSYIEQTSVKRAWLANELEYKKNEKYPVLNCVGFGMETIGGMSKAFKGMLQHCAMRMESRRNAPWTLWMNRLRSRLYGVLMKENSRMILNSGYLDEYW